MTLDYKVFADKSLKILLCLLLMLSLFFVQPKENMQSADAALPAVLVAVLTSVVLDVAVDMGIKFVDKKAGKKWAENIVGKLWSKYGKKLSDLKPTKTNAGKWTVKIGKGLLALIVDEIGDTVEDVVKQDDERKQANKDTDGDGYAQKYVADTDSTDPFYNTSVYITSIYLNTHSDTDAVLARKVHAYMNEWVKYEFKPIAYESKTEVRMISNDGNYDTIVFPGGYKGELGVTATKTGVKYLGIGPTYKVNKSENTGVFSAFPAFENYLRVLEEQNKKVYYADGVLTTDGYNGYIDLPDDVIISDEALQKIDYTKYPPAIRTDKDFEFEIGDSTVIDAEYEVINEGDQFEWEIIEQDVINQGDNIYKYDIDYNPVVNNYYTVTESQQDEIKNEIEIIIDNDVTVPSVPTKQDIDIEVEGFMYCVEKAGHGVVPCKEIEAIDGSLLEYVKQSYDYAVNAVKAGADGVKTIVAGSAGLLTLYSEVFDWLPDEATTILTSGLLLMIGLRVFRK